MKKNRGKEPTGFIVHINIEMSQGNSLHGYLYFAQAKNVISFLFSSSKSENRRTEQVLWGEGFFPVSVGKGRFGGNRVGG
jgi:hypothetical protein